jgi:hypothetical protein
VIDILQLDGALDLWLCMWEADEQQRYETAVVRAMNSKHALPTRLQALALSHVIATPRLLAAAQAVANAGVLSDAELRSIEIVASPLRSLLDAGQRLRGNVLAVEQLVGRAVGDPTDRGTDAILDWVDVRDLVAVARTTIDSRLFGEIERRIGKRGKYQRGRAANLLGFKVRQHVATPPRGTDSPIFGD